MIFLKWFDQKENHHFWLKLLFSRKMIVAFLMGFVCGVPLLLTSSVLQAWMKELGVDLTLIGLFSLVGIPYTLKFLWAPIFDRVTLPFLGRRRGWLLTLQLCLTAAIVALGLTNPLSQPVVVIGIALLLTFFSASQDIVVDAYRREDLSNSELGLGSSFYVNGYRLGMLLASGGGLILADYITFSQVYFLMGISLIPGMIVTLLSPEPELEIVPPTNLKSALLDPFIDFFSRNGAWSILGFILLYKLGDSVASGLTIPFYLEIGFSKTEIGAIVKGFGVFAALFGGFIGGLLIVSWGMSRSLWIFGILQGISTLGFAVLASVGHSIPFLSGVIAFENFTSGMGTSAYTAFMASLTNKKFTATQYALLSSVVGIPRVLATAPAGYLAKYLGWNTFFIICTLLALPGLLSLSKLQKHLHTAEK